MVLFQTQRTDFLLSGDKHVESTAVALPTVIDAPLIHRWRTSTYGAPGLG
jgi:hypothetical protein